MTERQSLLSPTELIREKYAHPDWQIGDWAHRRHVATLLARIDQLQADIDAIKTAHLEAWCQDCQSGSPCPTVLASVPEETP